MARHCPRCEYTSPDDFDETCPTCGRPLLTDEEHRNGWGVHAGNPDKWYDRRRKVQKVYGVIIVLCLGFAALAYGVRLMNELK